MTGTVRSAFIKWPHFNEQLRDTVAGLTDEQLAKRPSPERWPMWATIGHPACQRLFSLCDAAGRARRGDDPVHRRGQQLPWRRRSGARPRSAGARGRARFDVPDRRGPARHVDVREPRRGDPPSRVGSELVRTRGSLLQRVFAHDVYHTAELNEWLGRAGLPEMALWD